MSFMSKSFSTKEGELTKATTDQCEDAPSPYSRRNLMSKLGISATATALLATMGPVGFALSSGKAQAQSAFTDQDILNFALNLEYLEGEFYTRGATGQGLSTAMTTGTGTMGGVNGGTLVPFANPYFFEVAAKIAVDEQAHINFLRNQLGSAAVARPTIDLAGAFQAAAVTSGAIAPGQFFNPFADEISFFLGAFTLTEVGVTAYIGASILISSPAVLSAAASILATEAYHAGAIRGVLTQSSVGANQGLAAAAADAANGSAVPFRTAAIAAAQSVASNQTTGSGVTFPTTQAARISNTGNFSLNYSRTPTQVLNVVQGGPTHSNGDFFPNGLNGNIH